MTEENLPSFMDFVKSYKKEGDYKNVDEIFAHFMQEIMKFCQERQFPWRGRPRCTSDYEQWMHRAMSFLPCLTTDILLKISDHGDHVMNRGFTAQRIENIRNITRELCDEYYNGEIEKLKDNI